MKKEDHNSIKLELKEITKERDDLLKSVEFFREELTSLAIESLKRTKQIAELEAEVIWIMGVCKEKGVQFP